MKTMTMDERWIAKGIGTLCGILLSLVMIAPENTRNGMLRLFFGFMAGLIFMPVTQNMIPWLRGDSFEIVVAASAATGFVIWSILETIARLLSSKTTLTRLLQEVLRLRGVKVDIEEDLTETKSGKQDD